MQWFYFSFIRFIPTALLPLAAVQLLHICIVYCSSSAIPTVMNRIESNPVTRNLVRAHKKRRKKKSVYISKVNGDAHGETQSACRDRLTHEIPKLNRKVVIMKLAHQSSHYTAGILNRSAGKSSSGAHAKWSVNYERAHKQGGAAFGLHSGDSRRSTRPVAAFTACWCCNRHPLL